jgi:DNA-binding transcriptional MerR regulator
MLSIGELAHRTRVSVRMLRHYDSLGLVVPERVDAVTGYRWYAPSQIGRVNSLVALKNLGFTLDQCAAVLDDRISVEELRGMLRLRQAELEQRIHNDSARLAEVARRLRSIETGLTVTNNTLHLGPLPAMRLAQVSSEVNDISEIGDTVEMLTRKLPGSVRTFYGRPDGSKIDVAVGIPLASGVQPADGLEIVDLPAEERAAVVTHTGPEDDIADAWLTFDIALEERGLESYGLHRQLHRNGAVELQCPVRPLGSNC